MQAVHASSVPALAPLEALGASYQAQASLLRQPVPKHTACACQVRELACIAESYPNTLLCHAESGMRFLLPPAKCLLHVTSAANAR